MTQVNEDDHASADQIRRGPSERPADLSEPSRSSATGRAPGARPLRHAAGSSGGAGTARGHDTRRAGRAREGAAAVDDQGDRGTGGERSGHPRTTRHGPSTGRADGHTGRPGGRPEVETPAGSLAGAAIARADSGRTRGPASRGADPGEAQPVLTGPVAASTVPATTGPSTTVPATTGP